jgi:translation initiation factor IF-3
VVYLNLCLDKALFSGVASRWNTFWQCSNYLPRAVASTNVRTSVRCLHRPPPPHLTGKGETTQPLQSDNRPPSSVSQIVSRPPPPHASQPRTRPEAQPYQPRAKPAAQASPSRVRSETQSSHPLDTSQGWNTRATSSQATESTALWSRRDTYEPSRSTQSPAPRSRRDAFSLSQAGSTSVSFKERAPVFGSGASGRSKTQSGKTQSISSSREPPRPDRKPRDEEISRKYMFVKLVDPETGSLSPLTDLTTVIQKVRQMRPPSDSNSAAENKPENGDVAVGKKEKWWKSAVYAVELVAENPDPIVRVIDIREDYRKNKEARKKKQDGAVKEMQLQMTWSVDGGDLEHKLKKAREALEEGERVTFIVTRKRGQAIPKLEQMASTLQRIVDEIADVGKEWKERSIQGLTGTVWIQKDD